MEFAARAGKCLIADEMGLGKTIQAIGTASILYKEGLAKNTFTICNAGRLLPDGTAKVSIFYKRTTLTGYCDGCNDIFLIRRRRKI